jgi:diguanylate cyclase (GGDEF)-like protein
LIRAYTDNSAHAAALEEAARHKGYPLEIQPEFDRAALQGRLEEISVVVVDLTSSAFPIDRIISALDALDAAALPPVLYLLDSPAYVERIAAAEHIINQDYTFAPVSAENLALRLEVLTLLGTRRKVALESVITDKLTGLYNRKYFLRRLEEEMYRALRYNHNVGCILADVDFTVDSGELSEQAGTEAIKQVGRFFSGRLRRTDIVARFRWSEFAILLPDIPAEDSVAVARDLKQKVEALDVNDGGRKVHLHASVGQLTFPAGGVTTALQVVEALEDCAFKAKADRGGDVVNYEGVAAE